MYHAQMNILMVLADRDFPPDIRVEKEARSLMEASHKVSILCSSKGSRPLEDTWEGCEIVRLPGIHGYQRKFNTIRRLFDFIDNHWASGIDSTIRSLNTQILHVHDLPMLGTALNIAERYSLPVIADLHENYPAALTFYKKENINNAKRKILRNLLYDPNRWETYETRSVRKANEIIVVVKEAKDRLVGKGIPPEKIITIDNTVDINRFLSFPLDNDVIKKFSEKFVIAYIGGFGGLHRGVDTTIQAMPAILHDIQNAHLLLVGDGSLKPQLERMVDLLSLGNHVEFIPWQPFERIPTYVSLSKVCLVPHKSNEHTNATSPHKLYQYMLLKKPVVVSSCKPLQRIIEETNCGLVFKAGDPYTLAEQVICLKDPRIREQLGTAGAEAVREKYNWGKTSMKLVKIYERYGNSNPARSPNQT